MQKFTGTNFIRAVPKIERSVNGALVWDSIDENLNLIETPVFGLKDKRSVRDRWTLLKTKYKKKTREEEAASSIDVDDLTERESLIEE